MASVILAGTTSTTALNLTGDTSGELQLKTNNGSTTAMTLTTGGLVGIGETAPTHRLQVAGNSGAEVKVTRGTNSFVISLSNNIGGDVYVGTSVASALLLQTNNTERMRIDSSGNVGIGTSSPSFGLIVEKNNGSGYVAGFRATNTSPYLTIQTTGGIPQLQGLNSALSATVDIGLQPSGGNVGIGTASPNLFSHTKVLTISDTSSGSRVALELNGNSENANSGIWFVNNGTAAATIANRGSGDLTFGTGSSTPERMRIDSSGNVGIGTSSPSSIIGGKCLTLYNNGFATISVQAVDGGNDRNATLELLSSGNGLSSSQIMYGDTDTTPSTASPLVFLGRHSGVTTERMRITSDGNLYLGSTSYAYRFAVTTGVADWVQSTQNTNASTPYGHRVFFTATSPNNTGSQFIYCVDSGATTRAEIRSNGGLANYSGNNVNLSDEREKTNIELAGSYLDKICAIPVKTFNYIDQNREEDDGLTLGVIAQDVQKVAPEFVMESNWGTEDNPKMRLSIYQTDLQYALMKCIQEQQAMIEELKQEVASLKGV